MEIKERIARLNWDDIKTDMDARGYAVAKNVLTADECAGLVSQYTDDELYRKTVVMERHHYGRGEYKYFKYPLPLIIQQLRESVYPQLAPIANKWMELLNKPTRFADTLDELLQHCHQHEQLRPTPLILQYAKGGYNAMHQDLYGEVFFPIQSVFILDEPGVDYEGGEFILLEQKPREQSRAMVLKPGKGDMVLFTTSYRPAKGSKGYHRVNMKHGIAEITNGRRHSMGIIFHDAK
ncbi:2OG-Fe(II) oxygenase [Mucilaginibacter ginsenosidivorax]|uniref:Prolyl 4-hydroxylase subunit alpha n=1 Tax=Mucilaginibacter ginsenosidivorax TaxID=862126 RepID=A0A5B8W353_9SPHI|nr:2OG-Fe(II) oxygenase [Mucilaginibacter ginsenosidivorax]QEC78490.1 prolyl 4-hydroxylase subunit alpha [Mucilaginibacter ginsenosidivorax]